MERMKGTQGHAAEPSMNVWTGICGIVITWLMRMGKGCAGPVQEEYTKNKRGAKASSPAKRTIQQRRLIQQRIRRWNKTRKVKRDDKDRKKYRQKVRASLRWMRKKCRTEAKEANIREGRNRVKKKREKNMKRKGGAGGRGRARTVEAMAGALQKLEGNEAPTENDIQLEKKWRAAIQETVKAHGIPVTDDEFRGLGEGVQYTHGRLTRGGSWGGGRNTKH
eukprot:2014092-Pleurochrysis_carterae.AAC.1